MLFTTAVFVCIFLPIVLVGFFIAPTARAAAAWLFVASLFFYGYWMPEFTLLLLASICVNFFVGARISRAAAGRSGVAPVPCMRAAKAWMVLGVTLNLSALAYAKYANFFVANLSAVLDAPLAWAHVTLPIGISFFTFTQIAFLVDAYRHRVHDYSFVHYGLFVTYFPHLIAGPILHHSQMMPQFAHRESYRFDSAHFTAGVAIFGLGLIKKIVFADGVSPYADAVFRPADAGLTPDTVEAWLGACAYTLQLYFDFSGYSDMAIGLSWMFNIRLPFNFDSPYRATSISDFWRRWHISLSNFLRDYLYIALGGNRHGAARRYANLLSTMVLGGLWHGASWSFVLWGTLHGVYLVVNHTFRTAIGPAWRERLDRNRVFSTASWAVTLLAVIVAWVFFRAETLAGALRMVGAMVGHTATTSSSHPLLWDAGLQLSSGLVWCAVLACVAVLPSNTNRISEHLLTLCARNSTARAIIASSAVITVLFLVLVNTTRDSTSAFIYFNF